MRWKTASSPVATTEASTQETAARDRIRAGLEARGVDPQAAEALADQVRHEMDPNAVTGDSLLDGVALGFRIQNGIADALAKSTSELQEIERLMGAFASELSKLDEVLEVLAAHLRRMRTAAPVPGTRTVH